MLEEVLPLDALLGVDDYHLPEDVLGDRGDWVGVFGDHQRFVLDVGDQVDHVAGGIGWPILTNSYFPNSI